MTTFTQDDLDALANLQIRAAEDPATEEEMREAVRLLHAGTYRVPERNRRLTITLSTGHTVTLTHEWQPMGMCRHASISILSRSDLLPDGPIDGITDILGFSNGPFSQRWVETMANGGGAANVVEPLSASR